MVRYNEKRIPYTLQEKLLDRLCETLVTLKTKEAISDFLKDLLNRQERAMLVRRLLIAQLLIEGVKYRDIQVRLHCGMSTIARVERWLHFGRGGYLIALGKKKSRS